MLGRTMLAPTWIKICGVTLPADVEMVIASGASAIGLNFVSWSKRRVDVTLGRELAQIGRHRIEIIGVVSDLDEHEILDLVHAVGLDRVQVHGNESKDLLTRLGGLAFKAVGIRSREDVAAAAGYPGDLLVVDATVGAQSGGTGTTFDWSLVKDLCRARSVVVAGGLQPENVGDAIAALCPYGIDTASGVERVGKPGIKDPELVQQFVDAVRQADLLR
jgi:phosphoribosylanthranilate isomerase